MVIAQWRSGDTQLDSLYRPTKRLRTKTNPNCGLLKIIGRSSKYPLWLREEPILDASGFLRNLLETSAVDHGLKMLDVETEVMASAQLTPGAITLLPIVLQWLAGQATLTLKASNIASLFELADFLLCDKLLDIVLASESPHIKKKAILLLTGRRDVALCHASLLQTWARSDASAAVRAAAKEALVSAFDVRSFSAQVTDDDELIREIAALGLAQHGAGKSSGREQTVVKVSSRDRQLLDAVLISDPSRAVQRAALLAVFRVDGDLAEARVKRKTRDDPDFRIMVASVLEELTEQSKPHVDQLLAWAASDDSPSVRRAAMKALVSTGAVAEIAGRFHVSDPREREVAIRAFGELGEKAKPYVYKLLGSLQRDWVPSVLKAAVQALSNMGIANQYTNDLLNVMHGGKLSVQLSVVGALAEIQAAAELAVCLHASHAEVRRKAAKALGELGHKAAAFSEELLCRIENDQNPNVREAAVCALVCIGSVDDLKVAFESSDSRVHEIARLGLWQLGQHQEGL